MISNVCVVVVEWCQNATPHQRADCEETDTAQQNSLAVSTEHNTNKKKDGINSKIGAKLEHLNSINANSI